MLRELAYALRRVSTEYADAARNHGLCEYHVRIDITGLEREQSDRLHKRIVQNDRIPEAADPIRDPELLKEKRMWFSVIVQNVTNPQAALTIATDAVRRALHDEGIADNVTEFAAIARKLNA